MADQNIQPATPDVAKGTLKTVFINQDGADELAQVLELALDETKQVAGGLAKLQASCSCVNCCSNH